MKDLDGLNLEELLAHTERGPIEEKTKQPQTSVGGSEEPIDKPKKSTTMMPSSDHLKDIVVGAELSEVMANGPETVVVRANIRSILVPRTLFPILNYAFLAFTDQCVVVLLPLMYSSPISQGGLSFSSFTIGVIQGVAGVISGVLQIVTFARLHRRFGTKKLYITSFASFFICICAFPLMTFLAKRAERVSTATWVIIVVQNAAYSATFMTWGCIFMYISDAAPNQSALGLTNGLAQTTASVVRAMAPSTASSLFSASLEKNLAGGTLVYWILCAIAAGGTIASFWLPPRLSSESRK